MGATLLCMTNLLWCANIQHRYPSVPLERSKSETELKSQYYIPILLVIRMLTLGWTGSVDYCNLDQTVHAKHMTDRKFCSVIAWIRVNLSKYQSPSLKPPRNLQNFYTQSIHNSPKRPGNIQLNYP
jgi:hypothetical protein